MRRGRVFFYLAFIIILGVAALAFYYLRFMRPGTTATNQPQPTAQTESINVVVVTQKVPRGFVMDSNVLGTVPIPKTLLVQGMFNDPEQVVGKKAKFDLEQGIPLTSGMLVDTSEQLSTTGSVAALNVPRGMVAVSIPISRLSSVSYAPQAGDHVNVIVTMMMVDLDTDFQTKLPNNTATIIAPGPTAPDQGPPALTAHYQTEGGEGGAKAGKAVIDPVLGQTFYMVPTGEQRGRIVSQSLLQDVVVLNMGTFPVPDQTTGQATTTSAEGQVAPVEGQQQGQSGSTATITAPPLPDVVSLIVNPQDAVTLNYLIYSGAKLTLVLRAVGDDSRAQIEAVTLQFLLDQYEIPVPVKLPYGMEPPAAQLVEPTLRNDALPTPRE